MTSDNINPEDLKCACGYVAADFDDLEVHQQLSDIEMIEVTDDPRTAYTYEEMNAPDPMSELLDALDAYHSLPDVENLDLSFLEARIAGLIFIDDPTLEDEED